MSFLTLLVGLGLVSSPPPFGLLSDMALETSPKICHFFNHLLIVPLATSNLSAIACKVIPVALNSLACSLLSQLATPFFNPPNRPLFGLYLAKLLISPTGCVIFQVQLLIDLAMAFTSLSRNGVGYVRFNSWQWDKTARLKASLFPLNDKPKHFYKPTSYCVQMWSHYDQHQLPCKFLEDWEECRTIGGSPQGRSWFFLTLKLPNNH